MFQTVSDAFIVNSTYIRLSAVTALFELFIMTTVVRILPNSFILYQSFILFLLTNKFVVFLDRV